MIHSHWRGRLSVVVAVTAVLISARAHAAIIDVQCATNTTPFITQPVFTGPAVVGASGDFWNVVAGSDTGTPGSFFGVPLKDSAGNATPVTMNFFYTGFWGKTSGSPPWAFEGTPYASLMDQYAFGYASGVVHMLLSNLAPGPYDFYLYSSPSPDATARVTNFTVTTNSQTLTGTTGPNTTPSTFQEGVNYVHFQPLIGSDGQLRVTLDPGADEHLQGITSQGNLNGFQLVQAPEPDASIIVLATIAIGMLLARRPGPSFT
ncbi:MAG TPA: hypothetical protein VH370_15380 [Humisphaera sp.]|jgi:hypothetical protein|nr:hypothetical protein [Humisphaera sp.]